MDNHQFIREHARFLGSSEKKLNKPHVCQGASADHKNQHHTFRATTAAYFSWQIVQV
jgi:hypothetical protein